MSGEKAMPVVKFLIVKTVRQLILPDGTITNVQYEIATILTAHQFTYSDKDHCFFFI